VERGFGADVAADFQRRLTKCPPEGPPHALAVREPGFPRNDLDRVTTLLHQQPCSFWIGPNNGHLKLVANAFDVAEEIGNSEWIELPKKALDTDRNG